MNRTCLTSVTFRALPWKTVALLAAQCGFGAVEWGGDVHVPAGDIARAKTVAARCNALGLNTPSYGSYLRLEPDTDSDLFVPTLDTAAALGAATLRVWAGSRNSTGYCEDERERLNDSARRLTQAASRYRIRVAAEFHPDTLTDTLSSTLRLLRDVPQLDSYWQPYIDASAPENQRQLKALLPRLAHIHVFYWHGYERQPLAQGETYWKRTLRGVSLPESCLLMTEFVAGDDPERLPADKAALDRILGGR